MALKPKTQAGRKNKTVVETVYCSPGDVIPLGLNWGPWLAKTADTIYDFDGTVPGLQIRDSWFHETYSNMLVGPVPAGRFTANFDIAGESGEEYHRELKIVCR